MMFIKKHQQHIFPVSLKDSKTTCVQCYNTIVTFKTITKGHECVKFISLKQNKTYLKGNFQSIWKIISMNIIRSIKIYDRSILSAKLLQFISCKWQLTATAATMFITTYLIIKTKTFYFREWISILERCTLNSHSAKEENSYNSSRRNALFISVTLPKN